MNAPTSSSVSSRRRLPLSYLDGLLIHRHLRSLFAQNSRPTPSIILIYWHWAYNQQKCAHTRPGKVSSSVVCPSSTVRIMIIAHSKHSQAICRFHIIPQSFLLAHHPPLLPLCPSLPDGGCMVKSVLGRLENGFSILIESMKVLFVIYWHIYRNATNFVFPNFHPNSVPTPLAVAAASAPVRIYYRHQQ